MVFASLIIVENIILSVYYVYMYKGAIECRCSDTCLTSIDDYQNDPRLRNTEKGDSKFPWIYFLDGNVA